MFMLCAARKHAAGLRGRSPAAVAASGILATVIPFGQSVGDSMDLPRCFATLRLPCQARHRPFISSSRSQAPELPAHPLCEVH